MKKSLGFYANILTVVLALIGLAMYVGASKELRTVPVLVVPAVIVGVVLTVAALMGGLKKGDTIVTDLCGIISGVAYTVALIAFVKGAMGTIVNVFANHVGSVPQFIIRTTVVLAVTVVVSLVSGWLSIMKEA